MVGRVDRRGVEVLLGVATMVCVLAGCSALGGARSAVGAIQDVAQQGVPAEASQPRLTINPPDGAAGVSPTEAVTAAVAGGQLTQVDLRTPDGPSVDGVLSPDGERWASSKPLQPNTSYVLSVVSRSTSGQQGTTTSRFSTLSPGQRVAGKISPNENETVSADRGISVVFDKAIGDRPSVEQALRVTSNPASTGSTEWRSDRELVWRPTPAWPPGSQVTASLDMFGKQLGNGLFGAADLRTAFSVVDSSTGAAAAPAPVPSAVPDVSPRPQPNSRPQPNPRPAPAPAVRPSAQPRPTAAPRSARPSAPKPKPKPNQQDDAGQSLLPVGH